MNLETVLSLFNLHEEHDTDAPQTLHYKIFFCHKCAAQIHVMILNHNFLIDIQ